MQRAGKQTASGPAAVLVALVVVSAIIAALFAWSRLAPGNPITRPSAAPAATAAPASATTRARGPTAPAAPAAAPKPQATSLPAWAPELVEVPAGSFLMGSSDADTQAQSDEKPQHRLELPAYWIGKTEVTNAQFRPFVEDDGYTNRAYWTTAGWQWRKDNNITQPAYWDDARYNRDQQPVVGVSWFEAVAYCRWLSARTGREFRLPSEAEWEKAARGPDGRIFPWGNSWEAGRANTEEAGIGAPALVGQYPGGASPYGALDMAGNVYKWTATISPKEYPYQIEDEWSSAYLDQDVTRSIRGGDWYSEQTYVRGASRQFLYPRDRHYRFGLRVASHSPQ